MEGAGRTAVLRWVAAVRASPAVGTADLRRAQPADALERVAALRAAGVANRRHLNAAMDRWNVGADRRWASPSRPTDQ